MTGNGQDREDLLDRLVAEYADRRARGEDPGREGVLAAHPDLRGSLERLFAMVDAGEGAAGGPDPSPFPAGTRLGGFRILREVGRGGMGIVHLAEDTRVGRKVALKVLPAAFTSSRQAHARFRREAAVAARLDHPGICTVYETGEEDGVAFIAMRFLEGDTLASWIARSRRSLETSGRTSGCVTGLPGPGESAPAGPGAAAPRRDEILRVVHLFEKVARALHAAHEAGLIHRDVKPGNVMVREDGEPVLLDFGLARSEEDGEDPLTRTGTLMGTPAYMSPEQIAAQRIRLDRRTDVYSLGVALYECLTLRLPFEAPTLDALYHKILATDAEDPRRLNASIPAELRVVLETALDRDRDRRYGTALSLAEDLRRVREREPILARPAGPALRLRRWAQRNPAIAATVAVSFLGLSAALGISLGLNREIRTERDAKGEALASVSRERDAKDRALEEHRRSLRTVRALGLVNASREAATRDSTLSFLLAREALRVSGGGGTVGRLLEAAQAPTKRAVLRGHEDLVNSAVFSPDGKRILTASFDGTARIWDLLGRETAVLRGHGELVWFAVFSPDGNTILTGSGDGTARLWDGRGNGLAVLRGHARFVRAGAFSPDGTRVLTAGWEDATARLWDLSGRELAVLRGHRSPSGLGLECATFSPDGSRILTGGWDGTARLWDLEGREVAVFRGHRSLQVGGVVDAAFSPDGRRILTAGGDGTARLWDLEGNGVAVLEGHWTTQAGGVAAARFSPDGEALVTGAADGTARLWDATGRGTALLRAQESLLSGGLRFAGFSRDGARVLTGGSDGTARLWDRKGGLLATMPMHPALPVGGIRHASLSPDGSLLVAAGGDGTAALWDLAGPCVEARPGPGGRVRSASISEDGARVLAVSDDVLAREEALVHLWDGEGGWRAFPGGGEDRFLAAGLSADGSRVFTTRRGGTVEIRDPGGAVRTSLPGDGSDPPLVDVARDGGRIVTAVPRGPVRLWSAAGEPEADQPPAGDLRAVRFSRDGRSTLLAEGNVVRLRTPEGRETAVLEGHEGAVRDARFSPDGTRVVTASADGTARLWEAGGRPLAVLRGHDAEVRAAAFSPDGTRILTASEDRTARLWDASGSLLDVLRGHDAPLLAASFSADGRAVIAVGEDGGLRTWTVDPAALLALADARITRDFTPEERARYADLLSPPQPPK